MKMTFSQGVMVILTLISGTSGAQEVQLLLDAKAILGEGAIWHPVENQLYWVDIEGRKLHIYDPESGKDRSLPTGEKVGTVVPVRGGGVLVALQNGVHRMDTRNGELTFLVNAERKLISVNIKQGQGLGRERSGYTVEITGGGEK